MTNQVLSYNGNLPTIVSDRGIHSYLESIKKFPILSEKEEYELAVRLREEGDLKAAQKLITSHLRLAAKIAFSFRHYGLPMSDVISEANIGLMQAVKKYDVDKGVRLSTYAMWWIKAQINEYVIKSWSLVKMGTVAAQKKLFYNLNKIKSRLGVYDDKDFGDKQIDIVARELKVDRQDVIDMNGRIGGDSSLNVAVSDDYDSEKIEFLTDDRQNQEEKLEKSQEYTKKVDILTKSVAKLNKREQYVIKYRKLVEHPLTLEAIGEVFSISRERVRQIEKRALEKLSVIVKENMGGDSKKL